jgi:hypothetical protein
MLAEVLKLLLTPVCSMAEIKKLNKKNEYLNL